MELPLNLVSQIAALLGAITLLLVAPVEMFFYERPAARKFLRVESKNLEDVQMWAFLIGFRNLIAAGGVLTGLLLIWSGHGLSGSIIVLAASCYMLLSGLAMGLSDLLGFWKPRGGSIRGMIGSSLPPLVVIIAAFF